MSHITSDATFKEMDQLIWQHLADRGWDNPAPRSLAISLSLEANELLEHFQWRDEPVGDKDALAGEVADVLAYALQFAHVMGVDPVEAIRQKIIKSEAKYPAENFKGKTAEEKHQAWLDAKIQARSQKKSL